MRNSKTKKQRRLARVNSCLSLAFLSVQILLFEAMTILAAGGGYASTTPTPAAAKAAPKAATPLGA